MKYVPDKTMGKILNEVMEEFKEEATPDQIREMFILYWTICSEFLEIDDLPYIRAFSHFGSFTPKVGELVSKIKGIDEAIDEMQSDPRYPSFLRARRKYAAALERILKEKDNRKKSLQEAQSKWRKKTIN